jgi:hypothetical protein
MDVISLSNIRLFLVDEVFLNIVGEETTIGYWNRLEFFYMTK